jgi:hypothetical protein
MATPAPLEIPKTLAHYAEAEKAAKGGPAEADTPTKLAAFRKSVRDHLEERQLSVDLRKQLRDDIVNPLKVSAKTDAERADYEKLSNELDTDLTDRAVEALSGAKDAVVVGGKKAVEAGGTAIDKITNPANREMVVKAIGLTAVVGGLAYLLTQARSGMKGAGFFGKLRVVGTTLLLGAVVIGTLGFASKYINKADAKTSGGKPEEEAEKKVDPKELKAISAVPDGELKKQKIDIGVKNGDKIIPASIDTSGNPNAPIVLAVNGQKYSVKADGFDATNGRLTSAKKKGDKITFVPNMPGLSNQTIDVAELEEVVRAIAAKPEGLNNYTMNSTKSGGLFSGGKASPDTLNLEFKKIESGTASKG